MATALNLKGSCKMICDYFKYAAYSIIMNRQVRPLKEFQETTFHEAPVFVTNDSKIRKVLEELEKWLLVDNVEAVLLGIRTDDELKMLVETWDFVVNPDPELDVPMQDAISEKPMEDIQAELRAMFLGIHNSVTFLPILSGKHYFDITIVFKEPCHALQSWSDAEQEDTEEMQTVRFRTWSTGIHEIETAVHFKKT